MGGEERGISSANHSRYQFPYTYLRNLSLLFFFERNKLVTFDRRFRGTNTLVPGSLAVPCALRMFRNMDFMFYHRIMRSDQLHGCIRRCLTMNGHCNIRRRGFNRAIVGASQHKRKAVLTQMKGSLTLEMEFQT